MHGFRSLGGAALVALAGAGGFGCAAARQSAAPLHPSVPLAQSPSGGSRFTFCPDPPADEPMSLPNAAWLAFISANEYAHAKVTAPIFVGLGFGNPAYPRDAEWPACTGDLRALRDAQRGREHELAAAIGTPRMLELAEGLLPADGAWGSCARTYFESDAFDPYVFPAASFQRRLVQRVDAGSYLQFFSGGSIDRDGAAFTDASTQVLFARQSKTPLAIIAFRGTEPSRTSDLYADLATWKTPLEHHGWPAVWGSVHAGFLDAFSEVEPLLMIKLRELEGSGVPIWITGHSLGGALATLMAARVLRAEDEGLDVRLRGVYTFGSPRVGNAAFASKFEAELRAHGVSAIRVRNDDDPVTAIPDTMLGYAHVGRLAFIREGELQIRDDDDLGYDGPELGDHSISGFGADGRPTSGYYRRLVGLMKSGRFDDLARCDAPIAQAPAEDR
jgi:triacylglycerol lipase